MARSLFLKLYDDPPPPPLSVSGESDEEAGGEMGKNGRYRDVSTKQQNGKANVMLGEKRWCSK